MNMLKMNCKDCKNHCCGEIKHLAAVLTPQEEKKFKDLSKKVKTPHRDMFVLKQKANGHCIFYDEIKNGCVNYGSRPLDCQIYPLQLSYRNEILDIVLDERFCPHLDALVFDRQKLLDYIRTFHLPKNWLLAYETMTDY